MTQTDVKNTEVQSDSQLNEASQSDASLQQATDSSVTDNTADLKEQNKTEAPAEQKDTSGKLTNNKEIIAYISSLFPQSFILEGDAKPLKIGIFQDLAERLKDDEKVSKTQLRGALRMYTSSWRYLHCIKEGVERVDLDGKPCGLLEAEHVEHAQKTLAESKARVQARRKEQAQKRQQAEGGKTSAKPQHKQATKGHTSKAKNPAPKVHKSAPKNTVKNQSRPQKTPVSKTEDTRQLTIDEISVGKEVNVNMGQGNMPATIVEVNKNDVRVRLANGLQMGVKPENLHI